VGAVPRRGHRRGAPGDAKAGEASSDPGPLTPPPSRSAGEGEGSASGDPERGPTRRCMVTRARHPKEALIRFVVAPDGTVMPDLAARLPGRGMWLSPRADVLDTARSRGVFQRAAKAAGVELPVRVPDDLGHRIRDGLLARIADLIGLARRAGQAVAGHDRVAEWITGGRVGLLVQASDAAAGGRERMERKAHQVASVAPLPGAVLGRIFGRDHAVHVGIAPGRLAGLIETDCHRLAGFRPAREA
jgi:predicted RNA-binding protein YlxR (DUF448 family)